MRKGFTLIELLAVIAVLAIILIVAVPKIIDTIDQIKDKAYKTNELIVEKSATAYMSSNSQLVPEVGSSITIPISDMIAAGYMSTVDNPRDSNNPCDGFVEVKRNTWGALEYNAYITCGITYTTPGYNGLGAPFAYNVGEGGTEGYYNVALDTDGYVAVGYSNSNTKNLDGLNNGTNDGIVVKYDLLGNIVWKKNFGGYRQEYFQDVISVSDGYIVVGRSWSVDQDLQALNRGSYDGLVIKYDKDGNREWVKIFGGTGYDDLRRLEATTGGFVAVGYSNSNNGDMTGINKGGEDAIAIKYDYNGNIVWKKSFGGTSTDRFYSLFVNVDDSIVLAGYSSSTNGDLTGLNKGSGDGIIVKLDSSGTLLWNKNFGGTGSDYGQGITAMADGYAVVGYTPSTNGDITGLNKGGTDSVIVKYDLSGNFVWVNTYGGTGTDSFYDVSMINGEIIAVGYSESSNSDLLGISRGSSDGSIVRYSSAGVISTKTVLGATGWEAINGIEVDGSSYIVLGQSASTSGELAGLNNGNDDAVIFKYDNVNAITWKKNFGGGPGEEYFYGVTEIKKGFVVVGYFNSISGLFSKNKGGTDAVVVGYDYSGKKQWLKNFGGTSTDVFYEVATTDSGFVATGYSGSTNGDLVGLNKGGNDAVIARYNNDGILTYVKTFGGTSTDVFNGVSTLADGIIAVGYSTSTNGNITGLSKGSEDAIIAKFDNDGNLIWNKNFGGTGSDFFKKVVPLTDGYIAVGYSNSNTGDMLGLSKGGSYDAVIVKYDLNGNLLWTKVYGGVSDDQFWDIQSLGDCYYATGYSASTTVDLTGLNKGGTDAIIVKYDINGNIGWQKNHGGSSTDNFYASTVRNGKIVVTGRSASGDFDLATLNRGGYDFMRVEFEPSDGSVISKSNHGGSSTDYPYDIATIKDGVVMVGMTYSIDREVADQGSNYIDGILIGHKW